MHLQQTMPMPTQDDQFHPCKKYLGSRRYVLGSTAASSPVFSMCGC